MHTHSYAEKNLCLISNNKSHHSKVFWRSRTVAPCSPPCGQGRGPPPCPSPAQEGIVSLVMAFLPATRGGRRRPPYGPRRPLQRALATEKAGSLLGTTFRSVSCARTNVYEPHFSECRTITTSNVGKRTEHHVVFVEYRWSCASYLKKVPASGSEPIFCANHAFERLQQKIQVRLAAS